MRNFNLNGIRRGTAVLVFFVTMQMLSVSAQELLDISGQVMEKERGQALSGVSVKPKFSKNATSTDRNGQFRLHVPKGTVLVFSSVGYAELEIPATAGMQVYLSATNDYLDEVVVVGVRMKKSDLTGAVGNVDEKTIQEMPVSNINQAIQGRVAGVLVQSNDPRPGGGVSIKVRGNNSIQYGANPIYVVDGMVIEEAFNTINPDDIASIQILKDASATAIYGSRGANGVVLISTKKGKTGEGKIEYNAWTGVQSFANPVRYLNAQELVGLRIDAYANQYMDKNPTADRQAYIETLLGANSPAFGPNELEVFKRGDSYNWLDEVTRKGVQQNHTANFSKASEEGSVYVSFNYTDHKGLVKTSDYKRYGGQVNLDQKIKSWLRIGTNTNFSRTQESYVDGDVFNIAINANPLLPIDAETTYLSWKDVPNTDLYNPIRSLDMDGKGDLNRLLTNNYINATLIPGLNVRTSVSLDVRNQNYNTYTPKNLGQSLRNSTQGSATQRKENWLNWQWDNSVSYDKAFGAHNFSGLLSFGLSQNNYNYNRIDARGFATDDFSFKYLAGAYLKEQFQLSSDFVTNSLISYVARANYNYKQKYFATLTGRYDGSSKFGEGNKWGIFPSLALAWNIGNEDFIKEIESVSTLNLRAGYGLAGNQKVDDFAYRSLYRPHFTNNSVIYRSDMRLGNPNLVWEKQKQLNLGLDLGFWSNKLQVNADYFVIHNDDLLMKRSLSLTTGFNNTIANVGSLVNKGFELNVTTKLIENSTFQWNLGANISTYKNKITKLYGDVDVIYNLGGYTNVDIQREGNFFLNQPLNTLYTYKFEKIVQESDLERLKDVNYGGRRIRPGDIIPVDINKDGQIDDDDRVIVGKKDPKFFGGFYTDLSYKNFSLNTVFNYSYGAKALSGLYEGLLSGTGESTAHKDILNRWTSQNTGGTIPRALVGGGRYNINETDFAVQNASYLRLSALTLAYNFTEGFVQRAKMNNLKIYVTGRNLLTVTKYKGYDPEGGDGYPTAKMFVFGVNIGF